MNTPDKLDTNTLAYMIAEALHDQNVEIDNLGDSESIILTADMPIINLVQAAEFLIEKFKRWLGEPIGQIQ